MEDDAVVADLDDAALHLHLAAEIAQAKVDRVEVEAAADVGVEQGPAQVGPDVRLPLRVGDGVGRGVGEEARADVAVDVGLEILGDEPGAERGASAQLHRRAVDGDRQVLDRHASAGGEREPPRVDDDVAVELVRADVNRVHDRHLAPEIGAVERAAGGQLGAQIAAQPIDGDGSQEGLQQLEIEVAGERAGDGAPVEPPFDPQVAAVGGEVRLVERDVIAGDVDVHRARGLDPDPLQRRLAVGTVDGAGDRQPELGQEDVERQRLPRLEIDRHPPAGDAPAVAEGDQLGRQRVELESAEGDAAMNARPLGQERGVDVDVEAVEQLTVNGDAGRTLSDRPCAGVSARCPLPRWTPRTTTSARSMSPASSGRSGRPATCSLALTKPLTGMSDVATPGRAASGNLESATSRSRSWWASPTRPCTSAAPPPLVGDPQRLDGERLAVERQVHRADGELVAERGDRRAGGDRDVRRDGVERTVRVGGERDPTGHAGLGGQRRQIDVARLELQIDHRRLERLAGALLPEPQRAVRVDLPAERRPGETLEARQAVLEPEAHAELAHGALSGAETVHRRLARDARIVEAAVGLEVDARVLGERRQAELAAEPPEIEGHHVERQVEELPIEIDRPARGGVGAGDGDRQAAGLRPGRPPARRPRARAPRAAGRARPARVSLRSIFLRRADFLPSSACASIVPSRRPPPSGRSSRGR